jgi:multiple antibiotic resistance protein
MLNLPDAHGITSLQLIMDMTLILRGLKTLTLTVATLFPILNPLGVAPIFLNLTMSYPEPVRKVLSRKIAIYGFLLLAGSLAIGSEVLSFFGISLPIVQIAGGLVIVHTGWRMLNQESGAPYTNPGNGTVEAALEHAFYPLTLPLTVGPGCISATIAFGAHIRQQSTVAHINNVPSLLGSLIGMILLCIALFFCYGNASRLAGLLGPSGTNIVVRLSAFLLFALGVQIVWNGFSSSLVPIINGSAA